MKTKIKFASLFIKKKIALLLMSCYSEKKYIRFVIKIELFNYSKVKDINCSIYIMAQTLDTFFPTVA
jgi:hypothetical protein